MSVAQKNSAGPAMPSSQEFSSANLPEHLSDRDRFYLWRDIHFAEVGMVEVGISEMPFEATLQASVIGRLTWARMSGTVNRVTRTPQSIRTNSLDAYLLVMNLGQSVIGGTYRRNDVVMETRSAFLDACQPQQFMGGDHNVWANLVLPRKILDDRFARIEERQGLVIGSSNEALGLLHNYLAMVDTISPLPGSALIDHIGDTIIDLVGLATGAKGDDAELANTRGLRAARLQAVTKYIRSNYRNPALSASSIGLRTGLSARYVQDLLASTGDSLSERILELRLQDARAMLMDTRYQEKRIGDIALEVGFNDISYFNRSFKKRFGCSPRALC
ncbi:AraC family transcriptional regulator [Rhizobium sp. Leaf386]|uniref:helix-turn-helix transcriptional regulator n=1 Tax=Rhizobium sp. Leaf386 TaxID=1736359 RepID=UPI0012E1291E|nr:AraC family transcriptional regulator [Rhizobium sp. Leaf386]